MSFCHKFGHKRTPLICRRFVLVGHLKLSWAAASAASLLDPVLDGASLNSSLERGQTTSIAKSDRHNRINHKAPRQITAALDASCPQMRLLWLAGRQEGRSFPETDRGCSLRDAERSSCLSYPAFLACIGLASSVTLKILCCINPTYADLTGHCSVH